MSRSVLTQEEKLVIHIRFSTGQYTKAELARMYGVSPRTIGRVIKQMDKANEIANEIVNQQSEPDLPTYNYVCTPTTITITKELSGEVDTQTITNEDSRFESIFNDIIANKFSEESLESAFEQMCKKTLIENLTFGNISVDVEAGELVYITPGSGERVNFPPTLTARVISAVSQGVDSDDFVGLIKFVERLAWNPDPQVVKNLYDFLVAKDIKINRDGMVVCYKKVRDDFLDIYTGKIDNSPGNLVRVPRSYVDSDPRNTCSFGLHVCSWSYLRHYGTAYGKNVVVEVLVDPEHFVSIPYDYYETYEGHEVPAKARVSEYRVTKVVEQHEPDSYYEMDWDTASEED